MPEYLLVLEGRNAAHATSTGGRCVVAATRRAAIAAECVCAGGWIGTSVYDSIRMYTPCTDGVLVVPFTAGSGECYARNLREPITTPTAGDAGAST
jgi:hypothetical protein